MSETGKKEQRVILIAIFALLAIFLVVPLFFILYRSFGGDAGFSVSAYGDILGTAQFWRAMRNSVCISGVQSSATGS